MCQRDQVMTGLQCATEEPVLFHLGGCSSPESSCDLWGGVGSGLPSRETPTSPSVCKRLSPQPPGVLLRPPNPTASASLL